MMLHLLDDAINDLKAMVDFGFDNHLPDPLAYVDLLHARMAHMVAIKHPGRKGRVEGTREWVLTGTPYIVVYVERGTGIDVWRVLHGSLKYP